MFVALLFDPTSIGTCDYGAFMRDRVYETGILQGARKRMLLRIGDLLYYRLPQPDDVAAHLQSTNALPGMLKRPLTEDLGKHRVYAHAIRGIDKRSLTAINSRLWKESFYLGAFGIDTRIRLHRVLFDHMLLLRHLLSGKRCWTDDRYETEELRAVGFTEVPYVGDALDRFVRWAWQDGSVLVEP
jgi:hypothetical protein